ncbi:hypothetical protein KUV57_11260 [Epibacterium sp. DP7N7-1]|nr:hypothetical protein [Epibacterium sp. DP7N7-1]
MSALAFPMDPEVIAAEIDVPLDRWPGNCHAIATKVMNSFPMEGLRLVRGHFTGYISRDSVYHHGAIQQHSWLRLGDGRILDPTRWAIESPRRPAIYIGINDDYDEAGLVLDRRTRPQMAFSNFMAGGTQYETERAILKLISKSGPDAARDLADTSGIAGLTAESPEIVDAERLRDLLSDPVEHLEDPEALYACAQAAGLKAMIKLDNWIRVMEPEHVTPRPGANILYEAPPAPARTDMEKLFLVFARFLSIEERENTIEDELDEYGYSLEDLHDALNRMEKDLRFSPDLTWMDSSARNLLAVVSADLLGKGFGEELRVERFADSIGLDRDALHRAMTRFGEMAGFDLCWLTGREAELAMAAGEPEAEAVMEP